MIRIWKKIPPLFRTQIGTFNSQPCTKKCWTLKPVLIIYTFGPILNVFFECFFKQLAWSSSRVQTFTLFRHIFDELLDCLGAGHSVLSFQWFCFAGMKLPNLIFIRFILKISQSCQNIKNVFSLKWSCFHKLVFCDLFLEWFIVKFMQRHLKKYHNLYLK